MMLKAFKDAFEKDLEVVLENFFNSTRGNRKRGILRNNNILWRNILKIYRINK